MKKITTLIAVVLYTTMSMFGQVAINKDDSNPTTGSILHVKGDATNNKIILEGITNGVQLGAYTLPTTDGTANQVLSTDGNGNVTWANSVNSSVSVTDPGTMAGAFVNGEALNASNTATFTVTNNGLSTIGPIDFNTAATIGAGTATFSPAAAVTNSADYSAVSIAPGGNQILVYTLSGTPTSTGSIIVNFSAIGDLTSTATTNLTNGGALFSLPLDEIFVSLTASPGVITNGHTISISYTSGSGSYDAWTSTTYNITDQFSATRTITLSNLAGTFVATGNVSYTINITDGGGADIDVPQQTAGVTTTMAAIDIIVNGNSHGNLLLNAMGGYLDPEYGTAGHNYIYVSVDNASTGETWLNNNLGANYSDVDHASFNINQQATSSTDADAYGALYQWGRYSDGHEARTSAVTSTNATTATPNLGNSWDSKFITETSSPYNWLIPADDNLWQGAAGTNNPCPSGYRVATETEFEAERTSWATNNSAGAYGSVLKCTDGGLRNGGSGSVLLVGTESYYITSTAVGDRSACCRIYATSAYLDTFNRSNGYSVRCLKD